MFILGKRLEDNLLLEDGEGSFCVSRGGDVVRRDFSPKQMFQKVLRNFDQKKNQIFLCMLLKNWKSDIVMLCLVQRIAYSRKNKNTLLFSLVCLDTHLEKFLLKVDQLFNSADFKT